MHQSQLGQIESQKKARYDYKRYFNYAIYSASLLISWFFVAFFFDAGLYTDEKDIWDYFIIDITQWQHSTINVPLYYAVGGLFFLLAYGVFVPKSRMGVIDEIDKEIDRGKSTKVLKIKLTIVTYVDKFYYALFYPLSYISIACDSNSQREKDRFFIRYGWLDHLERSLFKRVLVRVDGYERAKELEIFEKYPLLYSHEKEIGKAEVSKEFRTTLKLFKNKKKFEDMFYISEGYISLKDKMKYDKLLDKESYEALKKAKGGIDNIRVFNGIDEVIFSFDLMKDLIDEECIKFEKYFSLYALGSSGMGFTRAYKGEFQGLKKDKKVMKMIASLPFPEPTDVEMLQQGELIERIIFLFKVYFRNVAVFHIINEYINLPAGTGVVLMEDYTLRMIIENYDIEKIIAKVPGKNDGTNEGVNGDNLVNMFLLAWNYYNHSVSDSLAKRMYKIYNLRDEGVLSAIEEKNIDATEARKRLENLESTPPEEDTIDYEDAKSRLFSGEL